MLERERRYSIMFENAEMVIAGINYYKEHPVDFIEDWCYTFDPRNAGTGKLTKIPFILFPRQREFINFLHACLRAEAHGLVEKSRDMGATWLCVAFSVWLFLFEKDATIGWGSRKAGTAPRSQLFELYAPSAAQSRPRSPDSTYSCPQRFDEFDKLSGRH